MIGVILPSALLYVFGTFSIFGIDPALTKQHLLFIPLGIAAYILTRLLGLPFFKRNAFLLYAGTVLLLLITFVIGLESRGSRRWISLYFFTFQPSELLKVFFVVFAARQFSGFQRRSPDALNFVLHVISLLVPVFVILRQPDLGSSMVYGFIFVVLLYFSSIHRRYLILLGIVCVLLMPVGYFTLKDYQKARITSFMQPTDAQGSAYNRTQAIITIGSGSVFGRGLGLGKQSQLSFLPENHTDFAFSSLVEQFGFVGGATIISLYGILCFQLARKITQLSVRRTPDESFRYLLTLGVFSLIFFQAAVNIGMNLGLLPITGITLPFISYGGSSTVSLCIALALITS